MKPFQLDDLFIYDLANNHQGDIEHAKNIISEVARVNNAAGVRGALKFQFRQLDTFIHPDFVDRMDIKFIKRFSEMRMEMDRFKELADFIRAQGLYTMCTPFDEESVDVICDMDLDIIKVASCSAADRPLLQKVARANKPVVVSTGGLRLEEIDWLVSFLEYERVNFAVMHCIAIYPTPNDQLQLNQVAAMRARYPDVPIGWSTHEDQDNTSAIQIALAKGARLFERHVGLNTEKYSLNAYSSTPEQLERWLAAYHDARAMLGAVERVPASPEETRTLRDLKRGVFARRDIAAGETLAREDVFFAMPTEEGQLVSDNWRPGIVADQAYPAKAPLTEELSTVDRDSDHLVYQIMLQVRGMLNRANVRINEDASIEISHHYGLQRFREFGAVIITCINRSYAKKLIVMLPRQKHPYHFHKKKEETFQLIDGDIEVVKNGTPLHLEPGDTFLVEPEAWHKFHTLDGCIFEEVSTTHYNNDSFYEDPTIARMERADRKTNVDSWRDYFRSKHAI